MRRLLQRFFVYTPKEPDDPSPTVSQPDILEREKERLERLVADDKGLAKELKQAGVHLGSDQLLARAEQMERAIEENRRRIAWIEDWLKARGGYRPPE